MPWRVKKVVSFIRVGGLGAMPQNSCMWMSCRGNKVALTSSTGMSLRKSGQLSPLVQSTQHIHQQQPRQLPGSWESSRALDSHLWCSKFGRFRLQIERSGCILSSVFYMDLLHPLACRDLYALVCTGRKPRCSFLHTFLTKLHQWWQSWLHPCGCDVLQWVSLPGSILLAWMLHCLPWSRNVLQFFFVCDNENCSVKEMTMGTVLSKSIVCHDCGKCCSFYSCTIMIEKGAFSFPDAHLTDNENCSSK